MNFYFDAEVMVPSIKDPELPNVFPLKPGVDQNIAMHASPTAKGVFLAKFDLSGAFTFILFQKSLSRVFLV